MAGPTSSTPDANRREERAKAFDQVKDAAQKYFLKLYGEPKRNDFPRFWRTLIAAMLLAVGQGPEGFRRADLRFSSDSTEEAVGDTLRELGEILFKAAGGLENAQEVIDIVIVLLTAQKLHLLSAEYLHVYFGICQGW